tara:strand:+ start:845 stop:1102 length:258 start_codon:yes stop_codon:yes gene_type:complete
MHRYYKALAYGLFGYSFGVGLDLIMTKLTENKYEKHYKLISYKKTFYSFLSLFGLCLGSYIGYNKEFGFNKQMITKLTNIFHLKI